jgi:fused signal recognition particle receptor
MVGVNGVGKTTSMGKLGARLVHDGKKVLFGAADTFRAAAVAQLKTWGERSAIPVVAKDPGADPASVAHDAITAGKANGVDVVIIDTAGRLHTKTALMDELGKVIKVSERIAPISEILLVIDATVGQNGLTQAKIFNEVVPVSGVVLTKFDGTAKGGIVISIQQELGVPVKFIGVGEGVNDFIPFDPAWFVGQMLETNL